MEYVYALHDFQPEAEDEIPFRAGEKIEVIEKDDEYGDGWWQVLCSLLFEIILWSNASYSIRARMRMGR